MVALSKVTVTAFLPSMLLSASRNFFALCAGLLGEKVNSEVACPFTFKVYLAKEPDAAENSMRCVSRTLAPVTSVPVVTTLPCVDVCVLVV